MLGARAIDNRVAKIAELEARKADLVAEIDKIKAELQDDMTEKGVDELNGFHYKVTWKEVVSNKFDTTLFKKERKALYDAYLKATAARRFLWKEVA